MYKVKVTQLVCRDSDVTCVQVLEVKKGIFRGELCLLHTAKDTKTIKRDWAIHTRFAPTWYADTKDWIIHKKATAKLQETKCLKANEKVLETNCFRNKLNL